MSTSAKWTLEKFDYTAGCPACEVHRAGLPMSGQGHTVEFRKRLEDAMTTDTSKATRVKATRVRQAERIIKDLDDSWATKPSSSRGSGQHKTRSILRPRNLDSKPEGDTEIQTGGKEASVARDLQNLIRNAWKWEPQRLQRLLLTNV